MVGVRGGGVKGGVVRDQGVVVKGGGGQGGGWWELVESRGYGGGSRVGGGEGVGFRG